MKSIIVFFILLPGLVWVMIACKPNLTAILASETAPTHTPTLTLIPELDLSPTSTLIPTQTLSPPSVTTVTPDWVNMAIGNYGLVEKLEYTPGCRLPCWWGITPGETKWKDVEVLLARINTKVSIKLQPNGEQLAEIYIPLFVAPPVSLLSPQMTIRSGVVQQITNGEFLSTQIGDLRSFLAENGKPDEIWVHSLSNNMGGPPPFDIWLFYWDKGIAAEFLSSEKRAIYKNGLVKACIEIGPVLYLWSDPVRAVSEVDKIIPIDFGEPFYPILPVEEAIGLSIEQFYEQYKNLDDLPQLACFTSNQSLWPEP